MVQSCFESISGVLRLSKDKQKNIIIKNTKQELLKLYPGDNIMVCDRIKKVILVGKLKEQLYKNGYIDAISLYVSNSVNTTVEIVPMLNINFIGKIG